ncbi:UDP-glucose 4-epimerase GalE [Schwartzia succinivorans]|jgi:UDP-glucose 4-epimerase|uniref:UDP-glucose 4-epimerase n=1 Tax=Schwartzia succinivorans DSM 10502 TaxID=1123243 RepID=A0A1M4XTN1_9FIRM|nr:UDP-glucose 4-epimerase GalE [Schwartzia succinivorans]SHE96623.1 UDP-glucose 4-epimerase [Schwartzia succinivorans DSM 10502]
MKVLITGGAGYIGSHCNRYFAEKGVETVVLDDLSSGHREAVTDGCFVEGDFGDRGLLDKVLGAEKFDGIIHFAAFIDVAESVAEPAKYYENNVVKMKTLLDAAVAHGVKHFVFSSTAAVFGEPEYVPIDEAHPKKPINAYGATKLIGEQMLADYGRAYGLRSCSFRYFNAAGDSSDGCIGEAHNPEHHLIPLVLRASLANRAMKVFGTDYDTRDGSCIRDYVHVEDLAEAHYLGLKYIMENDGNHAFNLGSSEGFSVLEILHEAERVTGEPVPHDIADRRPGDPAVLIASNKKAKDVLGWEPKRSEVQTILRDAWNWEQNKKY